MAHRARIIAVAKALEFPNGLPEIIAGYAELSDDDRLKLMLGPKDMITLSVKHGDPWSAAQYLYVQSTRNGIEISSSLTKENRECLDWSYFMSAMNARHIELSIMDDLDSWSLGYSLFERLQQKLIDVWWSM